MGRYMVRKWLGLNVRPESKHTYFKLMGKENALQFICCMFWLAVYIAPIVPLMIIDAYENVELSLKTQIIVSAVLVIHFMIFVLVTIFFGNNMIRFSIQMEQKIFFNMCTRKGNALLKEDFENIKNNHEVLYRYISTQKCRGYCYYACFMLLKTLKKGHFEFVAVKNLEYQEGDGKEFLIHVLYVNNGWAFDTYNACQHPVEEIHRIYGAKVYETSFCYNDIKDKSYEEFRDEHEKEITAWCENNDCEDFIREEED